MLGFGFLRNLTSEFQPGWIHRGILVHDQTHLSFRFALLKEQSCWLQPLLWHFRSSLGHFLELKNVKKWIPKSKSKGQQLMSIPFKYWVLRAEDYSAVLTKVCLDDSMWTLFCFSWSSLMELSFISSCYVSTSSRCELCKIEVRILSIWRKCSSQDIWS